LDKTNQYSRLFKFNTTILIVLCLFIATKDYSSQYLDFSVIMDDYQRDILNE